MNSGLQKTIIWAVCAACAAALAYAGYGFFMQQPPPGADAPAPGFLAGSAAAGSGTVETAPRQAPEGMREYRSETYRISLFYPDTLEVKPYDEGGAAATVAFQNAAAAEGFQIFIVPYAAPQIHQARFMQDVPSGVMESPLNVEVAGVPATSFYSTNQFLGDTAEIWFLRGGYLYEVTAPRSQAAWLSQIMNTLRFI